VAATVDIGMTTIEQLLQQTVSAWTANDADAFADLYTKDATVTLADGTYLRNRDEIRAYMAAGFEGRLRGTRGCDDLESIHPAGPDAAVAISRSGFIAPGASVPAAVRRATWTLTRTDDGWRVVAYANCPMSG
jgi:uncharacterized protein (TIGR02246 family)